MQSRLYVGNLPYDVSEDDLRELFSQAGAVHDVQLILDRNTRRPRGFAFVGMATPADAEQAIGRFNDYDLDGHRLSVNLARPREERVPTAFFDGSIVRSEYSGRGAARRGRSGEYANRLDRRRNSYHRF